MSTASTRPGLRWEIGATAKGESAFYEFVRICAQGRPGGLRARPWTASGPGLHRAAFRPDNLHLARRAQGTTGRRALQRSELVDQCWTWCGRSASTVTACGLPAHDIIAGRHGLSGMYRLISKIRGYPDRNRHLQRHALRPSVGTPTVVEPYRHAVRAPAGGEHGRDLLLRQRGAYALASAPQAEFTPTYEAPHHLVSAMSGGSPPSLYSRAS